MSSYRQEFVVRVQTNIQIALTKISGYANSKELSHRMSNIRACQETAFINEALLV